MQYQVAAADLAEDADDLEAAAGLARHRLCFIPLQFTRAIAPRMTSRRPPALHDTACASYRFSLPAPSPLG